LGVEFVDVIELKKKIKNNFLKLFEAKIN